MFFSRKYTNLLDSDVFCLKNGACGGDNADLSRNKRRFRGRGGVDRREDSVGGPNFRLPSRQFSEIWIFNLPNWWVSDVRTLNCRVFDRLYLELRISSFRCYEFTKFQFSKIHISMFRISDDPKICVSIPHFFEFMLLRSSICRSSMFNSPKLNCRIITFVIRVLKF